MPKFSVVVTIDVPDTTELYDDENLVGGYKPTSRDARDFVREAVSTWGGQRHPMDPFFKPRRVTVKAAPKAPRPFASPVPHGGTGR